MAKGKSRKALKKLKRPLRENILGFFKASGESFNYLQVSHKLGVHDTDGRNLVIRILAELEHGGTLEMTEKGKFRFKAKKELITGKLEMTARGTGYLIAEGDGEDILIPPECTANAFHGDIVSAQPIRKKKSGKELGRVVSVVTRGRNEFVGTLQQNRNHSFVKCDNTRYPDFYIPSIKTSHAIHGDKVIIRFIEWKENSKNPVAEVIQVLGEAGEKDTEMHAILSEYGLPLHFADRVEAEAGKIPIQIPESEISLRRDFRNVTTFTIDPHDAKDFDDALSIQKLQNGNWEIGVHIADVSHYVKEFDIIDREARNRATSVYLVDRVVPMLPELLSNGICSLVPNEDRLCFSAVFAMNDHAEVSHSWVGRTVIHSNRRFSYEEAQKIMDAGKGDFVSELKTLHSLANTIREKREKKGSIGFGSVEVKFIFDESGKPTGVYVKTLMDTNRLIEDFMLLANRTVAELIGRKKGNQPVNAFVYRVHPSPKEEKVKEFSDFVHGFGFSFNANTPQEIAKEMSRLIEKVAGTEYESIIENMAVRTMEKAYYTTNNIGHYGLAFDHYSHFTSPIRRYPDLMVHRLLEHYMKGGGTVVKEKLEDACKHCSVMEKRAQQAEWDSIKYVQVQLLQDRVGETFDAILSGVTDYGLFAELVENKCEGLIRLKSIKDDFYSFDDKTRSVTGLRKKKRFRMGDKVKVKLMRADLEKRQVDLEMVN